jgi:hypothetical protein
MNSYSLCKIWGFHGGDYEECPLLGYKNPVRTSQETHYVSATEPSRLMLCKVWGFYGGAYEEGRHLGMLCRVALVRTDVSEESIYSIIRVTRIGERGTTLALTSDRSTLWRTTIIVSYIVFLRRVFRLLLAANALPSSLIFVTLMMEAIRSSETSVLTRVKRRNIPEDSVLFVVYPFSKFKLGRLGC